jgi:hypothetical protein
MAKAGGAVAFLPKIINGEVVTPVTGSFDSNFFCPP